MSETIAVHLSNLIAGEQAYTHALSVCCDHYYKPLLEAQKHLAPAVFRPKDVRALFANAEQLLSTHRRFCEQINQKVGSGGSSDERAQSFARLVQQFAPLFKNYVVYSSSYHINAVPILDRFAEASGEWQPVADWIHAQQTLQSMSLATTLDMPLHRIDEYLSVLLALQSLSSSPEAFDKAMCALEDATGRKRNAPASLSFQSVALTAMSAPVAPLHPPAPVQLVQPSQPIQPVQPVQPTVEPVAPIQHQTPKSEAAPSLPVQSNILLNSQSNIQSHIQSNLVSAVESNHTAPLASSHSQFSVATHVPEIDSFRHVPVSQSPICTPLATPMVSPPLSPRKSEKSNSEEKSDKKSDTQPDQKSDKKSDKKSDTASDVQSEHVSEVVAEVSSIPRSNSQARIVSGPVQPERQIRSPISASLSAPTASSLSRTSGVAQRSPSTARSVSNTRSVSTQRSTSATRSTSSIRSPEQSTSTPRKSLNSSVTRTPTVTSSTPARPVSASRPSMNSTIMTTPRTSGVSTSAASSGALSARSAARPSAAFALPTKSSSTPTPQPSKSLFASTHDRLSAQTTLASAAKKSLTSSTAPLSARQSRPSDDFAPLSSARSHSNSHSSSTLNSTPSSKLNSSRSAASLSTPRLQSSSSKSELSSARLSTSTSASRLSLSATKPAVSAKTTTTTPSKLINRPSTAAVAAAQAKVAASRSGVKPTVASSPRLVTAVMAELKSKPHSTPTPSLASSRSAATLSSSSKRSAATPASPSSVLRQSKSAALIGSPSHEYSLSPATSPGSKLPIRRSTSQIGLTIGDMMPDADEQTQPHTMTPRSRFGFTNASPKESPKAADSSMIAVKISPSPSRPHSASTASLLSDSPRAQSIYQTLISDSHAPLVTTPRLGGGGALGSPQAVAAVGAVALSQQRSLSINKPIPNRTSVILEATGVEKRRSLQAQEQIRATALPEFASLTTSPIPPVTILGKSAASRRTPEMRTSLTSSNIKLG